MISSYEYTPHIWPMVTAIGFTTVVGIYSWWHRGVPGAKGLAFMMFIWSLKLMATTLGLTADGLPTKLFWFQIERFCLLPATVAGLVFALEYGGLDTWLNRRTLTLLAIPALLLIPLTFTNNAHHLIWTRMWFDGRIRFNPGIFVYPLWGYGLLLGVATIAIFIWLFIRSPLHRWPVGLILLNMFTSRALFYLTESGLNPVKSLDLYDLGAIFICPVYFVALFYFRLFDVVPVARSRVIEQMRDGMLVIDAQTRIADLNGAAQELLGIKSKVIGREAAQALLAYPKLLEFIRKPAPAQDEIWLDDVHCYRIHISPLATRHGFGLGKLILFYDISEEKEAQKQLQEQQRRLAIAEIQRARAELLHVERSFHVSELTASLAHELNQPLAAILSNAQAALHFLESGNPDLNEFREILRDIVQDDKRAGNVIRSLRSMMKREEGEKKPIILNDVLQDVVAFFHSEAVFRNVDIETDFERLLPPVLANGIQLQQVTLNLIMNAAQAMSKNLPGERRIILRTEAVHNCVRASVRDFGGGIPQEDLKRLFQPFFTTKESGLGMGLAVSKSIIQAHGGLIWAENNPEGGATFVFELPVKRNE